jgi:hypothetical protein
MLVKHLAMKTYFLFFNYATNHEDVWRSKGIAPCSQLHDPTVSLPGKQTPVPIE